MHGACVSCNFPISFTSYKTPVACPFCATINQAVQNPTVPLIAGIVTILGIVIATKVGRK